MEPAAGNKGRPADVVADAIGALDGRPLASKLEVLGVTGGCQCGSVRFEIAGQPLNTYVCHCRECQKQSASAFGISVIVAARGFRVLSGTVNEWARQTDSGRPLICRFCADCGSRLWHATPLSETVSVKGGTLDAPIDLASAIHIWTTRKLSGVIIPDGAVRFPAEPD